MRVSTLCKLGWAVVVATACGGPPVQAPNQAQSCEPVFDAAALRQLPVCQAQDHWPKSPSATEVEKMLAGDDCYDLLYVLQRGNAYQLIRRTLHTERSFIRARGLGALQYFPGCPDAVSQAQPFLSSDNPGTRGNALHTWVAILGPEALEALRRATSDDDDGVRSTTIDLLAELGTPAALSLLKQIASTEPNPQLAAQASGHLP